MEILLHLPILLVLTLIYSIIRYIVEVARNGFGKNDATNAIFR